MQVIDLRPQQAYSRPMNVARPVGEFLREWRQRRNRSQLDLACDAEISTKHLSFLETGRSQPSREMLLLLAGQLEIPLREQNVLLLSAGYAPVFSERSLDDPTMCAPRQAVDLVVRGHEPYPAFAIDRHWNIVASNRAIPLLFEGVAPQLLIPPVNALRVYLHPQGLARRTVNLPDWRAHLLARLDRQIYITADPQLLELRDELSGYLAFSPAGLSAEIIPSGNGIVVPLKLEADCGLLSLFTTTTTFGSALDVTMSELTLECFYPTDALAAEALKTMIAPLERQAA